MTLNSLAFLAFLAIVLIVYYALPKKLKKYQWVVLLIASYGFYLSSGITNVLFIMSTTVFTFASGLFMQRIRDKQQSYVRSLGDSITKEEKREYKKIANKKIHTIQVITALVNLGVLIILKCHGFLFYNLDKLFSLFKWDVSDPLMNLIVPLCLSYYTFNSIGYLIDIGRGKHAAERNIGKFALFVSFFPSIVQGPLFRYCDVGVQLTQEHKLNYDNIKYGAQLILWGFFKKLVIADRISAITAHVFSADFVAGGYNGTQVFFGVLAYSFQIYGDFSGGTDITRGAAQMMGIDLPLNFERPFFATSMADFWRRWHMSLGAWMREFVFYPVMLCKPVTNLSKKFRKKFGPHAGKIVPSVAAPFVVFFLIGIWHGITWQYVTNGLYNAILISSTVALTPAYNKLAKVLHVNTEAFSFRIFQMLRTFMLLCISRIIVKAPSLTDAFAMIKSMFTSIDLGFLFGSDGEIFTYGVDQQGMIILIAAILLLFVISTLQESGMKIRESLSRQNLIFRWFLILLLLTVVLVFGVYGPEFDASSFIYGKF
ncbi:MAG: MBOAT family O-acyltransferase [Eubacteriales bacterium]|nr:MBOAT family O-acyltransferase [Eubacteriales bacterium]